MIHTARQAAEALIACVVLVIGIIGGFGMFNVVMRSSGLDWLWAGIGLASVPFIIGGALYWFREIAD